MLLKLSDVMRNAGLDPKMVKLARHPLSDKRIKFCYDNGFFELYLRTQGKKMFKDGQYCEPVKIDTLARNMIRLSGFTPDVDIKLTYTGLRPGEKLFEEKLMAEEGLKKTENDLIHIGCPIPFDVDTFLRQLDGLMEVAYKNREDVRDKVQEVVNTYHPAQ